MLSSPAERGDVGEPQRKRARQTPRAARPGLAARHERLARQQSILATLTRSPLLSGEDLVAAFRHLTELVAGALAVERVSLWLFDEDRSAIRCVDLFEQGRSRHSAGTVLKAADYPTYFQAIEHCEAMVADDVTLDPRTREFDLTYTGPLKITAMMDIPLHLRGQLVGVVCHEQVETRRPWEPEDRLFALAAANLAALALEQAARREADRQLLRQNEYLAALNDTTLGLLEQRDRESLLESVVARAGALLGTPHGFLYAVDAEADELVERVATGIFEGLLGYRLRRGQGVVGKVWDTGQALAAPDDRRWLKGEGRTGPLPTGAVAAVPLRVRGAIVGVLGLTYLGARQSFGDDELALLSRFGELASLVLESARQQEELELRVAERTTELAAAHASLRRSETLSAMGTLVAGVAHEVRNPLFAISASLDALEADFGDDSRFQDYRPHLRSELARVNRLMQDLLDYGRPASRERAPGSLSEVIGHAVTFCQPLAAAAGVTLETRLGSDLGQVSMDRERLAQVFQNLIQNGIQHCMRGGTVTMSAWETRNGESRRLLCAVEDTGPGFRREDLGRVFEPFFTRRRGGTGLGLSIAQRIVEEHGGTLTAGNRRQGGAILTVSLPAEPAAPVG